LLLLVFGPKELPELRRGFGDGFAVSIPPGKAINKHPRRPTADIDLKRGNVV
jgi:hypothetical protein